MSGIGGVRATQEVMDLREARLQPNQLTGVYQILGNDLTAALRHRHFIDDARVREQ